MQPARRLHLEQASKRVPECRGRENSFGTYTPEKLAVIILLISMGYSSVAKNYNRCKKRNKRTHIM